MSEEIKITRQMRRNAARLLKRDQKAVDKFFRRIDDPAHLKNAAIWLDKWGGWSKESLAKRAKLQESGVLSEDEVK